MNEDTHGDSKDIGDIMEYKNGVSAIMYDATIAITDTASVKRGNIVDVGGAARDAEMQKNRKFLARCIAVDIEFIPLAFELGGLWGDSLKKDFKKTIAAAAELKKIDISFIENYWTKRIAITLQRGLANKVIERKHHLMYGKVIERDESADLSIMMLQTTASGSTGASSYEIK
jgi:hypothetical protein